MARMKRQATLLIVILLSLCIPSLSQAQGTPNYNEWVIAEFPVVNSEVKNAGDYYTWIVPLNLPQTSSIPAYVTNWMEIDAGPASSLLSNFMQVGLITTNAGVQWFFATDPEVDPYTYVVECPISGTEAWHNSQNQPRGCLGNPGDFGLDVNIWSRVQLVTYGQGFWIARVTDINGNKHDIAKIYNWYTYASRATVAFEESWIATSPSQNPWLIGKFYSKDFKYRVGHNWINMPSNIGGNYGSNFVWTTSNSGASVCPSQYGVNSSVFNDPYWWFMGTGGSQCNNLLYTGGGPNTAVTNILADSIGKFVSSNNSTNYMKADRILPADWEEWKIQPVSGGKTAFQANTGKWASSNNGTNYMKADKNTIGSWEKFTKVNLDGSGLYFALKANNGKYVSHNNGTNYMKADRNTIGSWEKFRFVAH